MILLSIFFWFAAYNAVTTAFSRYAVKVWGLEGGGFADCLIDVYKRQQPLLPDFWKVVDILWE